MIEIIVMCIVAFVIVFWVYAKYLVWVAKQFRTTECGETKVWKIMPFGGYGIALTFKNVNNIEGNWSLWFISPKRH